MNAKTAISTSAVMNMRFVEGDGDQPIPPPRESPPCPGRGTPLNTRPAKFIAATPFLLQRAFAALAATCAGLPGNQGLTVHQRAADSVPCVKQHEARQRCH